MMENKVKGAIFGFIVGDALGLPVEFYSREELKAHPIKDMKGFGTYNQPPGTWSDDTSMTLCTIETLFCKEGDIYNNLAECFVKWYKEGYWTPTGNVFDIGFTTASAIYNLSQGINPLNAGARDSKSNGGLLRALPIAFYTYNLNDNEKFQIIHNLTKITHANPVQLIANSLYISFFHNLIDGLDKKQALNNALTKIINYYADWDEHLSEFEDIINLSFLDLDYEEVPSDGYVVSTLIAALWTLFKNNNYKDTVLSAVNLGGDTDSVAAVAGSFAGFIYGYNDIPEHWINKLAKLSDIQNLINCAIPKILELLNKTKKE